jgi:hypothetical protein
LELPTGTDSSISSSGTTPLFSVIHRFDKLSPKQHCPLQFSLGISKRWHRIEGGRSSHHPTTTTTINTGSPAAIRQSPVVQTIFPQYGPGKSVVYTTLYEHVDLLSPAPPGTMTTSWEDDSSTSSSASASSQTTLATSSIIREALLQNPEFPWLYEGSAFLTSPIVHDVNGDGIPDIILTDYDGGIYIRSVQSSNDGPSSQKQPRYTHVAQAPRLYVRRNWVEARVQEEVVVTKTGDTNNTSTQGDTPGGEEPVTINQNNDHNDPYHTYFEYYYAEEHKESGILRGITANHLGYDTDQAQALKERRKRRVSHERQQEQQEQNNGEHEKEQEPTAQVHTNNNPNNNDAGGTVPLPPLFPRRSAGADVSEPNEQLQQQREEEPQEQEQEHRRLEEVVPDEALAMKEEEGLAENEAPEEDLRYDDFVGNTADDMMADGGGGAAAAAAGGDDKVQMPYDDYFDRSEMEEEGKMFADDLGYGGNPLVRCCLLLLVLLHCIWNYFH